MRLSEADKDRIEAAVVAAEARTAGEVFCIVTGQASDYRDVRLAWASALALGLPAVLAFAFAFTPWTGWMGGGWSAAHIAATETAAKGAVAAYAVAQAGIFALVWLILSHPAARRWAAPPAYRRAKLHREAMRQFLAKGLHLTEGRTGVLIIAALDDHQAEIVADEAIHAKVGTEAWADALEALRDHMRAGRPADGFIAAVEACGALLAEHFPPTGANPDELPNRLVEI